MLRQPHHQGARIISEKRLFKSKNAVTTLKLDSAAPRPPFLDDLEMQDANPFQIQTRFQLNFTASRSTALCVVVKSMSTSSDSNDRIGKAITPRPRVASFRLNEKPAFCA